MSLHQFQTIVALNDVEVPVDVEFEYQPEEKQTWSCPGCRAEIYIESAKVCSNEIPDFVYPAISDQIVEDAWNFIKNQKESDRLDRADYLIEQAKYEMAVDQELRWT